MLRIDVAERRARLVRRHHLAAVTRAATPTDVARSLVALHSSDPASVYLACMARTVDGDAASVSHALYRDRTILRMLGMRRTVFVVPVEVAPVVHAACTADIAALERTKLVRLLEQAGIAGDGRSWLARVEEETLAALDERGEALGQELSAVVPGLRQQISLGDETKKWAGVSALTSRVLFLLAADGRIVRGEPRGSWVSSQYRWARPARWLGDDSPLPASERSVELARVELARRWLASFAPGTVEDLRWWTGWTAGVTKRVLAELKPLEVDLDGRTGMVLPGDLPSAAAGAQRESDGCVALLPALDPTAMGWFERSWFLGDEQRAMLFDRSGNVGPTVWCDGQVVGGWAQRRNGEVAVRLLVDAGADFQGAVERAADRLARSIGDVRITPRFRTPIERQLSA